MTSFSTPFEIHVHGEVALRDDVDFKALQEATKPLWKYAGAKSLTEGAQSLYEEEPGIRFEAADHKLQLCWTVRGNEDFRQVLDDLCMNINEVSAAGAQLEITFYDTEFEDDEDNHDYNEERFNRANIEIEGYDGKTIQVIQYAKSQGLTRKEAESNAKKIKYNYLQKGQNNKKNYQFETKMCCWLQKGLTKKLPRQGTLCLKESLCV